MRVALGSVRHELRWLVSAHLHHVGSGRTHVVPRPSKKARPTRAPSLDLPMDPNLRHVMIKTRENLWH
eukprot:2765933-Pyramimonas_sp.AAC.1